MKKVLLTVFLCISSAVCFAQENENATVRDDGQNTSGTNETRWGIRTNALSWIALTPGLEFDAFLKDHWNISAGGSYGWWGFNGDKRAVQSWRASAEARYYFKKETFTGHALGLRAETGQFDVLVSKKNSDNRRGRRGQFTTAGLVYAYSFNLDKNHLWYMDAGLGAGYIYAHYTLYEPYKPTESYHRLAVETKHMFGLTNVFINIGYRFPLEKKGGAK